jgi:uncharacterized membrane protein
MSRSSAPSGATELPEVAQLVQLHHRRRGWSWVAVGSLIGLVVYVVIGVNLFANLTGTAETASIVPVFVLLALMLAGLVVVIVDSVRIHRADASIRVSAKRSVSHYPLYAHAHSYPPRHHGSWVFAIFMLVTMTGICLAILPAEVNSWAYVIGAGNQDTFNPVSYGQACSRAGCHTVTNGYLSRSGADVTWASQVPLGQPLSVRDPLWAWGTGRNLITSDGPAVVDILVGLFFNGVTILLVYALLVIRRIAPSRRRNQQAASVFTRSGGVRHPR